MFVSSGGGGIKVIAIKDNGSLVKETEVVVGNRRGMVSAGNGQLANPIESFLGLLEIHQTAVNVTNVVPNGQQQEHVP